LAILNLGDNILYTSGNSLFQESACQVEKSSNRGYFPSMACLWSVFCCYLHTGITGPMTMNLDPQAGTNTFGRTAFRIHGDNPAQNFSASEGCIVAGSDARAAVARTVTQAGGGDNRLDVVP
jgi:hypothetical protein